MVEHEHSYSPLIHSGDGRNGMAGYLTCQDCGHDEPITGAIEARWQAAYDACVAEGRVYQGVLGYYFPPGVDHPPMA